ncbi:PIN-like domain-containing protein [Kosakonia sp. CFBP8986]|uniref:PIN-like domain-containing protein n=1 Tax=Kosakonia sp. CFBP8986 TaxID=3096524 RepID=UPI002A6A65B5|nr:PIN-like domain-containing protein [Kosakonia sp. CFBP8986]MDY0886590.1 PIN-like domain-containing protein [Kosakonia sp. CFBP8986]
MKNEFRGFYSTPDESLESVWRDDTTLFVLDTNCLLNLYRCEDATRENIIKVMRGLSHRIWIPFQVGYEYQRTRRTVIEESISSLSNIKHELIKFYKESILEKAGIKKHLYNKLSHDISEFQENLQNNIDTFITTKIDARIKNKEKISKHDFIRDELDEIISERVGSTPTQEEIDRINDLGEDRYQKKIPPGFKDSSKKGVSYYSDIIIKDKFGDLYLWEQLIVKAREDSIETVVFVSDDVKEDWVFIHKGITHGPLESLKTEICKRSNLKNFRLINQLSFLREAKDYLPGVDVSNDTLDEVKDLVMTPVHPNVNDSAVDNYFEHELPNAYQRAVNDGFVNYFDNIKNKKFKAIKELILRSEEALDNLNKISSDCIANISILNRYSSKLNEMYGESSIERFIQNLSLILKDSQIIALTIKNQHLSMSRVNRINAKNLEIFIDDLERKTHELKQENEIAKSYINDLL